MTGEYDDKYVIEDGVWKMSQCHFTGDVVDHHSPVPGR